MRCLTVSCNTAPGIRPWLVDQDCVLIGGQTSAGTVVVSENPTQTAATFVAAASDFTKFDSFMFLGAGAAVGGVLPLKIAFPLSAGKTIYVANSSSCTVLLYLDDPPTAEPIAT